MLTLETNVLNKLRCIDLGCECAAQPTCLQVSVHWV